MKFHVRMQNSLEEFITYSKYYFKYPQYNIFVPLIATQDVDTTFLAEKYRLHSEYR